MTESQAKDTASKLNGEAYQSGGNIWLVLVDNADGTVTVHSDEGVMTYASREAFHNGEEPIR